MKNAISAPPTPFTLGTAQIGIPYGIANSDGLPNEKEAIALLEEAWRLGVRSFDTARMYGLSESRIGEWSKTHGREPILTTKTGKLPDSLASADNFLRDSLASSLQNLKAERVDYLLLHRCSDIKQAGVETTLQALVEEGLIGRYGVSAYTLDELTDVIQSTNVSVVQCPISILDGRVLKSGFLEKCEQSNIFVFARSLFLQGVLFLDPEKLPHHLNAAKKTLINLRGLANELGRSLEEIAIVAIRDLSNVGSLVVGVETITQLHKTTIYFNGMPLTGEEVDEIFKITASLPEDIISPQLWPR